MKFLVTGATGFVGSWLTRFLLESGNEVRVLHRSHSDLRELEGLKLDHCIGDVTDRDSVLRATKDIHSVFHLAGLVGYSRSMRENMELVNIRGTQNILEACQANPVKRIVHFSSVVAVGASFDGKIPLNENSPYNIQHLDLGYFETKHTAEQMVSAAVKSGLVDAVILNPATIYGPGDARKGSRKTQLKVAKGKFPFYTSGGVSVVAIQDVVKAAYTAWESGRSGERYILAGDNILIKDLFSMIAGLAGVKAPRIYLPNPIVKAIGRVGDILEKVGKKGPLNSETAWTAILYHWFDHSKAKKELGFSPMPAHQAVAQSVEWSQKNGLL